MSGPLAGVRVLDFSQFFAGPICTMLLGDMGAEIIKLENPPLGDAVRYSTAIKNDKSTNYTTRNRGKKSVCMNLKDEKQKELFFKMLKDADVVVDNFKPGTLDKYGLTYEAMKEVNPRIVYTSISGYGQDGPYRDHAAFDGAVQAESGIMSINGEPGGTPIKCGVALADATAGLVGCIGTLGALYDAKQTGNGRRVDVSMLDSMITIIENFTSSYLASGDVPGLTGNRHWTAAPFNSFTCKGGAPIYIGVSTNAQFQKFCAIVNHPEWAEDPKFAIPSARVEHAGELEKLVQEALTDFDVDDLCEQMQKNSLVYGKINDIAQVTEHPQALARNMFVNAVYPDGTSFKVPGNPIKMTGLEERTEYPAADFGCHTFEVLSAYADEKTLHDIYDGELEKAKEAADKMYHPDSK